MYHQQSQLKKIRYIYCTLVQCTVYSSSSVPQTPRRKKNILHSTNLFRLFQNFEQQQRKQMLAECLEKEENRYLDKYILI